MFTQQFKFATSDAILKFQTPIAQFSILVLKLREVSKVLKQAKVLKDSDRFKTVFFNKDLTVPQITQLTQLIQTRNTENAKLDAKHKEANTQANQTRWRNDKVVKVYFEKSQKN